MNELNLTGNLGPHRVDEIRSEINLYLDEERPQLRICLSNVETFHLGIANVLVAARSQARSRCGDIDIVVDRNSDSQRLLGLVGIVGTITP